MLFCPWDSPGKNTGVGCQAVLQAIFSTQRSNLPLQLCRQILYHCAAGEAPNTHTFISLFLKCWQLWTRRNKTKSIWSSLRELWKLSKMIWKEFKCHICLGFAHLISKQDQFIDNWRKQSLLYGVEWVSKHLTCWIRWQAEILGFYDAYNQPLKTGNQTSFEVLSNHWEKAEDCSLITKSKTQRNKKLSCRLHLSHLPPEDLGLMCFSNKKSEFFIPLSLSKEIFLWAKKGSLIQGSHQSV